MAVKTACGNGFPLNIPSVIPESGGSGGTSDYSDLTNKPQINSVTLSGNKSLSDIGAASASDVSDIRDLIPSDASITNLLATADDIPDAVAGNPGGSATAGNLTKIQIGSRIYAVPGGSGNINEYSLSEVLIGTYLGANLYRKCFDIGALTGGQTKEFITDLIGVTVRNYTGYVTRTTDGNLFKCPYVWDSNSQNIGMGIDYNNNYVRCLMRPGSDYSNITGFMVIEYTKNS